MTQHSIVCHEAVARRDILQPCDSTAVAVRIDPASGGEYPVCIVHVRDNMVALSDALTWCTDKEQKL